MKRLTFLIVKITNINSLTLTRNAYSCLIKNKFDTYISVIIFLVLLRPIYGITGSAVATALY